MKIYRVTTKCKKSKGGENCTKWNIRFINGATNALPVIGGFISMV